jgi:hypothetical protein
VQMRFIPVFKRKDERSAAVIINEDRTRPVIGARGGKAFPAENVRITPLTKIAFKWDSAACALGVTDKGQIFPSFGGNGTDMIDNAAIHGAARGQDEVEGPAGAGHHRGVFFIIIFLIQRVALILTQFLTSFRGISREL